CMRALTHPSIQPEQDRLRQGRGSATELRHVVDETGVKRQLAKANEAHAAAGILPAKRNHTLKRSLDLALAIPALVLSPWWRRCTSLTPLGDAAGRPHLLASHR